MSTIHQPSGKTVVRGGLYGKRLVTKEAFLRTWEARLQEIAELAESEHDTERLAQAATVIREIVLRKAATIITESEALAFDVPKYLSAD